MNEHAEFNPFDHAGPELEINIADGYRVYLAAMVNNLNHMCGTGQRPDLAQLQAIRDTLEHFMFTILTKTPLDYSIIN